MLLELLCLLLCCVGEDLDEVYGEFDVDIRVRFVIFVGGWIMVGCYKVIMVCFWLGGLG